MDLEKDLGRSGGLDALAFGFPGNGYSLAGERKGMDGACEPLYSYGKKALKIFQPRWFLAENAGGAQNREQRLELRAHSSRDEIQGLQGLRAVAQVRAIRPSQGAPPRCHRGNSQWRKSPFPRPLGSALRGI